MQEISTGHHQPKSKAVMLPIIDLKANDSMRAFNFVIGHRTIEEVKCEGAFNYI